MSTWLKITSCSFTLVKTKTFKIGPGDLKFSSFKQVNPMGGAVAEWCKALQLREKISKNKKDPRFAPRPGQTEKKQVNP